MSYLHRIEVTAGPDRGLTVELSGAPTVIGRGEEAGLRLSDQELSRRHCQVTVRGRRAELRDLASTNGTSLNGRPLGEPCELKDGDVIGLGGTQLRYTLHEGRKDETAGAAPPRPGLAAHLGGLAFAQKVLLLLAGLALVGQGLAGWLLTRGQAAALEEEALRRAGVATLTLAALNRQALRLGDAMLVDARSVAALEGVRQAVIYDRAGRTLAPVALLHQPPGDDFGRRAVAAEQFLVQRRTDGDYDLAQPVRVLDPRGGQFERVGTARILFSTRYLAERTGGPAGALAGGVLLVLAALGVGLVIVRLASRPLDRLRDELEAALRDDRAEVRGRGWGALERLAGSLNRTLAKLRQAAVPTPPPAAAAPGRAAQAGELGEELRALAAALAEGVLVVDAGNQVLFCNPAAGELLGRAPEDLGGRHLLEAIPDPGLLAGVLDAIQRAAGQPGRALEASLAGADGRALQVSANLLIGPEGEPRFIALALRPA